MMYLYNTCSHYRYQRKGDINAPEVPRQDVGHWSMISLHTPRVFVDPTRGVLFKILTTRIILMVQAAIIEYTLRIW